MDNESKKHEELVRDYEKLMKDDEKARKAIVEALPFYRKLWSHVITFAAGIGLGIGGTYYVMKK